jgi:hypothetical protein
MPPPVCTPGRDAPLAAPGPTRRGSARFTRERCADGRGSRQYDYVNYNYTGAIGA